MELVSDYESLSMIRIGPLSITLQLSFLHLNRANRTFSITIQVKIGYDIPVWLIPYEKISHLVKNYLRNMKHSTDLINNFNLKSNWCVITA